MASVRLPEGQQRSGSQGGIVFSHNRFGAYIRARSIPVNPQSARQVAVRNALRDLSIYWNSQLSQAQRDAWQTYADVVSWPGAWGDPVFLSGQQHYVRSNVSRLLAGLDRIDTAPTGYNLAISPNDMSASISVATQELVVTFNENHFWVGETGGFMQVRMGIPQNPSRNFFDGPFRIAGVVLGDDASPPTSPATITPLPWPVGEGNAVWVEATVGRADGRYSLPARDRFLVSA